VAILIVDPKIYIACSCIAVVWLPNAVAKTRGKGGLYPRRWRQSPEHKSFVQTMVNEAENVLRACYIKTETVLPSYYCFFSSVFRPSYSCLLYSSGSSMLQHFLDF